MWEKILRAHLKPLLNESEQLPRDQSAAVLVLYCASPSGDSGHILLTKRTTSLETHKGQMSFPGGYREKEDRTWLETALRETEEEIGVLRHQVKILGCLGPVLTKASVTIIPYMGILETQPSFNLNADEVEKTVLLPVETLVNRGLKPVTVREGQHAIQSIGLEWEGELIWGATARILEQLYLIFLKLPKPVS